MKAYKKLDPDILEKLKKFDTPSLSDAMDRLGIPCAFLGIHPVVPGTKMCGQAYTVHYVPCGQKSDTVGDFIDDVEPGEVVVIDNSGRLDCTVWGDIMSLYASKKGIGGTLIDGVCRDIETIRELNYPIFTKSTYMRTGKDRVYVDHLNEPVNICSLQVLPGDVIFGDDSGVVVIPLTRVNEVIQIATEIEEKEEKIRMAVLAGSTLKEARATNGYHSLQTRREN